MYKRLIILIIYLFSAYSFSQDYSALWEGHFSYNQIKDIAQGNGKIYAAADNAVFSLDVQTNEMEELSTINGLSGETITTIYYSEVYELLIIGYENGLIEIAFDNDDEVLTIVDVIDKVTIPPTDKKINHFNTYQNVVYISTNYGVSVFDLERLEFGDTYFIGNGGTQIPVNQTTIFNDFIYAACSGGNGIKKAEISNPNLIDFQNWQQITSGNFTAIETHESKLYTIRTNRRIYEIVDDVLSERFFYSDTPLDLRTEDESLIVTTQNNVFIYDIDFDLVSQIDIDPLFDTQYSSATIDSNTIYIGTNDFGILKTEITNPAIFQEIHPEGPLLNIPFSIETEPNGLWVTFGEYDLFYNPYPLNSRGFSHLKDNTWINNRYSEVFEAKCLNEIAINPFNTNQVFISSFFSGLLEVNEDVPTVLYNQTNSGLESLVLPGNPNYVDLRVGTSAFDNNGLLWTLTSRIEEPLKSFNPDNNQWQSFSFTDVIADGFAGNPGFADITIGSDNTKWVASYEFGLIGYKENGSNYLIKSLYREEENMPVQVTTALALDNRNQLWIGTFRGLRVLYNTSNFFTDENVRVEEIIIEEDGVAKELLFQQYISDIEVDGSNNKWIGTDDSGVFYFSSDGQNTIFHFTKDNSPLPSNSIRDIALDTNNGTVYIATSKGLVSFNSGGSSPFEDLENVYAYPNPVRPNFNIVDEKVKIKDISENVNIKITDIEGNLVAEAQSRTNQRYNGYNLEIDGGTAYWNGKNLANNVVASGVYLIMLSDLDTFETKVLKLMVVR
ncbi:ABC transporter substrate-binding protein [Flaviramulus sp. BrNp1-15]|uniref:type IX secretion system anionic LPS delivery protein PorZ n=1 Tax=Flaviramulus sp. BrNp1-15 TaxID=2916754 RepID=UPI001EE8FE5F|nr:ABC transporter substrate-binding protein [Flaviramulus sp. BrNp1-15]ULC59889.1 ABC transporter substrate-binding protein [Flaviramulus sp. BrNp1-15]